MNRNDLIQRIDAKLNDNGTITGQGMATFGLRGQNYNVLMEQANKYRDEMKRINAELANDKNNTKLIERRQELIDLQRESILAAEDEKQAIKDLVKNAEYILSTNDFSLSQTKNKTVHESIY